MFKNASNWSIIPLNSQEILKAGFLVENERNSLLNDTQVEHADSCREMKKHGKAQIVVVIQLGGNSSAPRLCNHLDPSLIH